MKVGNFNIYKSFYGPADIWVSKNPCGGFFLQFCLLAFNMVMFGALAYPNEDIIYKVTICVLTVINSAIFIKLCFSNPGVPA